jgi:iron(III) transport system substrate-binding protein
MTFTAGLRNVSSRQFNLEETRMRMMLAGGLLAAVIGGASPAAAQGSVNVYCSVQVEWCQAIATGFERDTGIKVNMTQKGSGETLAQIRAEAQNPKGTSGSEAPATRT